MKIIKPLHKKYALHCLDNETYVKYANAYSGYKRWGVRGIYIFLGGTRLWGVRKKLFKVPLYNTVNDVLRLL